MAPALIPAKRIVRIKRARIDGQREHLLQPRQLAIDRRVGRTILLALDDALTQERRGDLGHPRTNFATVD